MLNRRTLMLPLLLMSLCGSAFEGNSRKVNLPQIKVKRVVFIGDSITYDGRYVSYIEAYLKIKHPALKTEFINVGLPSETVSGLSELNHANGQFPRPDVQERLVRVLDKLQPDKVFSNYGINDGIYLPFDNQRFLKFQEGTIRLHEQITSRGIELVHIAPPIFDAKHDPEYADVIHKYADWLLSRRQSDDWQVIDAHWPMQAYLDERRKAEPEYYLAKDGIHPDPIGHGLIANQVLLYLGESPSIEERFGPDLFNDLEKGSDVLQLISKRQAFLRNAWLSETGHKRPNIEQGMPLEKAKNKARIIDRKLVQLLE